MSAGMVRFDEPGGVLVARLSGEVDLSNAEQLGLEIAEAAARDGRGLVVDLTEVEYIDSYGMFVIHGLRQRLGERRQTLVLIAPRDGLIRRTIELVGLADVTPIKEELQEALREVGGPDS